MLARWRVLSATVIGAMVPDFRVFFPGMPRVETHSAMALLTFCLPVGLITYWAFERLIKTPIVEVLPEAPLCALASLCGGGRHPQSAPVASGRSRGVLAGALSHLVWDGFTHDGGRGVRMFPVLDDSIIDIGRRHVPAIYVMQDLGSVIGLAAVVAMVCYALRPGRERVANRLMPRGERIAWVVGYLAAATAISAALYFRARFGQAASHSIVQHASDAAIASLRGLAAALLGVSLALQLRLRALRQRSSGPER